MNQAAGDRLPYAELARHLSDRGIGSLRIDLRGHGESVNQGRFIPGRSRRDSMIWDAEVDVAAALEFMRSHPGVNGASIGLIGASYSGEEAAEAARNGYAASVYVFLSPGSFSDESVWSVDSLDVPWLFVSARDDRHLADISAAVAQHGQNAEITLLPGSSHATDLLAEYPDLPERIAVWLAERLVGIGMSPVE